MPAHLFNSPPRDEPAKIIMPPGVEYPEPSPPLQLIEWCFYETVGYIPTWPLVRILEDDDVPFPQETGSDRGDSAVQGFDHQI